MNKFLVAHLVKPDLRVNKIAHIIAVPLDPIDRPSIIVTEDGLTWIWGGMYQHFPNTGFYLEVQPALFTNRMMKILSRAVPTLERQGAI